MNKHTQRFARIAALAIGLAVGIWPAMAAAEGKGPPVNVPPPFQEVAPAQAKAGATASAGSVSDAYSVVNNANQLAAGGATAVMYTERAAASALAPGVAVAPGTCFGSAGVGVSTLPFGLSGSRLELDRGCVVGRAVNVAMVVGMDQATVHQVACQDEHLARTKYCQRIAPKPTAEQAACYSGDDPIVRRRCGMQ